MRRSTLGGAGVKLAVAGVCAVAACLALPSCYTPSKAPVMKYVDEPRAGRAVGRRVALVYSRHYQINLGGLESLHSFDIRKYARIYQRLLAETAISPGDFFVPDPVTREQILRVHTEKFLASLDNPATVGRYLEQPTIGKMPAKLVDASVVSAFRRAAGGTVLAARLAMEHGVAINLAGGYHHAKPDAGEGFCIYNDIAIAIRDLQAAGRIRRALVIDLDVHQGNGTAVCFARDDSVFTFSMHEGDIYPIPKAVSDVDIELPAGTGDDEFLRILRKALPALFDRARPDLVVLQAGCDTFAGDPLAHLAMTAEGIVRRDATVIDECVRREVPVVMTLGGGYSRQAWTIQYASIRRTLETHAGLAAEAPSRKAGKVGKLGKGV